MGAKSRRRVDVMSPDDREEVVSVIGEAFFDYPVMRFVLGADGDYAERLATLLRFFVMARFHRDEVVLGVRSADGLEAAALISYPGRRSSPPELDQVREETWSALGTAARSRYEAFGAAASRFEVEDDHVHLNMVGVRNAAQGRGLGRAVLDAVHDLSATDAESAGVTLTTEVESNVPLYRHFGYEVLGRAEVESAFTTWFMYRRDPGADGREGRERP